MKDPVLSNISSQQAKEEESPSSSFDLSRPTHELLAEYPHDHKAIAMAILAQERPPQTGKGYRPFYGLYPELVNCIQEFHGLDEDVAMKLIERDLAHVVLEYMECFGALDEKRLTEKLVEYKKEILIFDFLEKFPSISLQEITQNLSKHGGELSIVHSLEKLHGLSEDFFVALAKKAREADDLAEEQGYRSHDGEMDCVAKHLQSFENLSSRAALALIASGHSDVVIRQFDRFHDLDQSVALALEQHGGEREFVAEHQKDWKPLEGSEIVKRFLDVGIYTVLLNTLGEFEGIDHDALFRALVSKGVSRNLLFQYLRTFHHLKQDIALNFFSGLSLIDEQTMEAIASHIESFSDGHQSIAEKLIEKGGAIILMQHFQNFHDLDYCVIAQKLLDAHEQEPFIRNLHFFKGLDWSIGKQLFVLKDMSNNEALSPHDRLYIWDFFSPTQAQIDEIRKKNGNLSFKNDVLSLTFVDPADAFLEKRFEVWKTLTSGFPLYSEERQAFEERLWSEAIHHPSTAKKFVSWFSELPFVIQQTPWVQEIFANAESAAKQFDEAREAGKFITVHVPDMPMMYDDIAIDQNILRDMVTLVGASGRDAQSLGEELVDFRQRFGLNDRTMQAYLIAVDTRIREKNSSSDEKIERSRKYSAILQGISNAESEKDISSGTLKNLSLCREKIQYAITKRLPRLLQSVAGVSQEESERILGGIGGKGVLRSLEKTFCDLFARYIAESTLRGSIDLQEFLEEAERVIADAVTKYAKIYEVDIPLYDKLYEEFDELREAGRSMTEVYLGRDGIYAYFGRKALGAARRKKKGIAKLSPKYLMYPRNFRDYMGKSVLKEYLQQESVTTEADPLFYDTGFTGSIPEQIMQIQGFAPEEIENRIRLLSASSDKRRVKGIGGNARSEIVSYIEANVKAENASFAIIRDATNGRLRPVSTPTTPKERFLFGVVKQAIARHYWFKEISQGKNLPYVEVAKEKYVLHLVKEAMVNLDGSFLDHADELLQAGHVLKGNDGIVDGDIRRLTTADGKMLIAKAADMNRVAVDEHELKILERAQKLGLQGVVPIGLLRLKGGIAYTLMEDVPGLSGRTIRQSLERNGWSRDEINALVVDGLSRLTIIADDYRAKMNIDKPWRLKDCMIQLDETSRMLVNIVPLDWERAQAFDPEKPHSVREK